MKMKKEIRWYTYLLCVVEDWKIHTSNEVYTGSCMNHRWAVGVSGGGGGFQSNSEDVSGVL